jgi:prevent-host-death family protein
MTRIRRPRRRRGRAGRWALQDAKARFSELVRRAKTEGPQLVTVHGRDEVVVVSSAQYRRLRGEPSGEALVKALRGSPLRDVELDHEGTRSPVRGVAL